MALTLSEPDASGNVLAEDGIDRCYCGCKYWENDRCVDCGAHVSMGIHKACATCNSPEGSAFAKKCCTPDNMIEV